MKLPHLVGKWAVILLSAALLVPTTFVYSIGALALFMFMAAFLMTAIEAVNRLGWTHVLHSIAQYAPAESPGINAGQFSLFIIGSGIGIAAAWATLGLAVSGARFREVPKLVFAGIAIGWLAAMPILYSGWPIPKGQAGEMFNFAVVKLLFGGGPAVASALLVGWLAWSGGEK